MTILEICAEPCHIPKMDKEPEIVGRVVEVKTRYLGDVGYLIEIFYVAVDNDDEALAIVKRRISHTDEEVNVLGLLSPAIVKNLGMTVRQVRAFGE